jgi:beta-xylosidase
MGAEAFITRQRGMNASEAYTHAVEAAESEHGRDSYNGTISTTTSFRDVTADFRKSKKDRRQFIDDMLENAGKRECYVIEEESPVKNNNKIKSVVDHKVVKGTSKWELRYNVYTGWEDKQLKSFKTKTDAVKYAREYTEKTQNTTFVRMEKTLINQNANVACIKYKRSTSEQEGQYVFFGMAAC